MYTHAYTPVPQIGLPMNKKALHYITVHYVTLHYITLRYITLCYVTLHYITLHYITLLPSTDSRS